MRNDKRITCCSSKRIQAHSMALFGHKLFPIGHKRNTVGKESFKSFGYRYKNPVYSFILNDKILNDNLFKMLNLLTT